MTHSFRKLDKLLDRLTRVQLMAVALCGVLLVGWVDYITGYEVSVGVFYLGPVALAAWYTGRWSGIAIAVLSCMSWFAADLASGHPYSNSLIPVWNALVRFGVFLIVSLLLTTLRETLHRQQYLARTDGLTGLYGRRAFEERLEHDLALAKRSKGALTLAYVDVDDFRNVNETHGHAGGDGVLRLIGRVFTHSVREGDTAARIGGDEFAVILPGTDSSGAQQVISRLARELREALAATNWGVTCSFGVVTLIDAAVSTESAVAAADEVMYRVKRGGKGAVEFSVLREAHPTTR